MKISPETDGDDGKYGHKLPSECSGKNDTLAPPQRHVHVYSQNLEADITGKFAFKDVIKYWILR